MTNEVEGRYRRGGFRRDGARKTTEKHNVCLTLDQTAEGNLVSIAAFYREKCGGIEVSSSHIVRRALAAFAESVAEIAMRDGLTQDEQETMDRFV